ncbi:MAG: hypothetical protein C4554_07760 [Dethiobacter sp.]|jgi:hypothetical protein|nr:MAG: hypothetical protein C4554_07760 [Dethiobacter sp.]
MLLFKKRNPNLELEKLLLPALLLLLVILAYYNIIFLENARPGRILKKTLSNMEQNYEHLEVEIIERGQGYRINFRGSLMDNKIYGKIPNYMLEIYKHSSGELFAKDLTDGLWKSSAELKLDTLQEFFISPFELLGLWSHLFKEAKFVNYSAGKEKVVLLNISPHELEKTAFLKDYLNQNPFWLECLIFIEPEELFINQIIFSLYDKRNLESILSRTFSLKCSGSYFPDVIPASILKEKEGVVY